MNEKKKTGTHTKLADLKIDTKEQFMTYLATSVHSSLKFKLTAFEFSYIPESRPSIPYPPENSTVQPTFNIHTFITTFDPSQTQTQTYIQTCIETYIQPFSHPSILPSIASPTTQNQKQNKNFRHVIKGGIYLKLKNNTNREFPSPDRSPKQESRNRDV